MNTQALTQRQLRTRIVRAVAKLAACTAVITCVLVSAPREAPAAPKCVRVNTASAAELDRLPQVGVKRAAAIVAARAKAPRKRFASLADLARRVRGIGPKTVAKWSAGKLVCRLK